MKKAHRLWLLVICLAHWGVSRLGIGYYSSGSAVLDLKEELELIHGKEYTGKVTDRGTEDMVFLVEPKTFFLTDWNLRHALSMDYEYECKVITTAYVDGKAVSVSTVTYQAVDPMGWEHAEERAHLILDSKTGTIQIS